MKIFKVNEKIEVRCESENNRKGFRHIAKLFLFDVEVEKVSIQYINRTWEKYNFESVLKKLEAKCGYKLGEDRKLLKDFIENPERVDEDLVGLRNIGMVAMLGDILGETKKDKNDWKKRMLKAGLGEGMILPDDFDELPEKEKERRLNGAIKIMTKQ